MTPGNPILDHLKRCGREGYIPCRAEVYELARFRQAGGIGRLCEALIAFTVDHMAAHRAAAARQPHNVAKAIANTLLQREAYRLDRGAKTLIVIEPDDLIDRIAHAFNEGAR